MSDALWFIGLGPYIASGFFWDDQPPIRRAISQGVAILGVLCHGTHLIRHELHPVFWSIDVVHSVLATAYVNLTASTQPDTLLASIIAVCAFAVNRKWQSPALHGVAVQGVLWLALSVYDK